MIFLYIILGIILLILLLLMLRIRITVSYTKPIDSPGTGGVFAGIGPVKIKLYPKKEKKLKLSDFSAEKYREMLEEDAEKKAKKTETPDKKKDTDELLPGGIGETFELISELLEKFTGHLRCEVLKIRLNIGTKNAATTAYAYSGVASAVSFILEALDNHTKLRLKSPKDVFVKADFDSSEIHGDIAVKFSIRIINILRAGGGFIMNYIRTMIRLDNQNSKNNNAAVRRNGDKNE